MFDDSLSLILWLTSATGLFLALYAAAPKAWQTLSVLNGMLDRGHGWLKRNVLISDVYDQLRAHADAITDHEARISAIEGRSTGGSE